MSGVNGVTWVSACEVGENAGENSVTPSPSSPNSPHSFIKIEVVCCSVEDCVAATQAGADRIELCCAIELGGLTPSLGLMQRCRAATTLPIVAMVRPRAGGFVYSQSELEVMVEDSKHLLAARADGLAFGCLTPDSKVDFAACQALVQVAKKNPCAFHRAFDGIGGDLIQAAADAKQLGFARILTSGRSRTALEGIDHLKALASTPGLEVVAAGGVRADTVEQIISGSGVNWVHMGPFVSAKEPGYQGASAMKLDRASVEAVRAITNRLA